MRKSILAVSAITSLILAGTASASGWTVVKTKSVSGQYAATLTSATINNPKQIAVKLVNGTGDVSWLCSKGFSSADWSKNYGPGLHPLAHVSGESSCTVSAEITGKGKITVQILTAG